MFCPAPPTSPDRRPSGERGVKELPTSSLDCSSRWCCSLPRPTMRVDMCRIEDLRSDLERTGSPRYSLWIPVLYGTTWVLARSPFVLRTFPPRAGETEGFQGGGRPPSGSLSLAESAYPPHPRRYSDNAPRNRVSAAFRPSSQTSFTTCGGYRRWIRVLAAPCSPARGLFTFIQLSFCSVFERLR